MVDSWATNKMLKPKNSNELEIKTSLCLNVLWKHAVVSITSLIAIQGAEAMIIRIQ